jgi:hypothetical protein
MLELLEQTALHDYPNPKRVGGPGPEFLFCLAYDRGSIDISDVRLTHVAPCSPCFREVRSVSNLNPSALLSCRRYAWRWWTTTSVLSDRDSRRELRLNELANARDATRGLRISCSDLISARVFE